MDLKAIIRNAKNKGVKRTLRIARNHVLIRLRAGQYKKTAERIKALDRVTARKELMALSQMDCTEVLRALANQDQQRLFDIDAETLDTELLAYMPAASQEVLLPQLLAKMPMQKQIDTVLNDIHFSRQDLNSPSVRMLNRKSLSAALMAWEKDLAENHKKDHKKYTKLLRPLYLKELYPAAYAKASQEDVVNKVIVLESGNSPSPSSSLLAKRIARGGKYKVHKTGLHIRAVSDKEFYENGLAFVRDAATAKAIFLSTANDLLSQFDLRPETKLIQLWHGCGMFKRVGFSTADKSFGPSEAARMEYYSYRNYSHVTIAAEAQAWTFEDAMRVDKDVIAPIGISRTDRFFDTSYAEGALRKLHRKLPQIGGRKIILYAPTFRGAVKSAKAPDQLDVNVLGEALSEDYVLLIKHHGLSKEIPPIPEKWKDSFAFDLNANPVLGIDHLLAISDICITDYSSVGFEYSLMERPLVFFAYDIEDYLDKRGMYYDYDEITPGPVCKRTEEVADYIAHIDERFDKQQVIDFKQKYMGACDGHSTERTIALIES